MRPLVDGIAEALLSRHRASGRVHLNDIDEVIAGRAVSYEEVEYVVDRLEAEGLRVGEPPEEDEILEMQAVLMSARTLRGELGRVPSVAEVGAHTSLPDHVVRRCLEHATTRAKQLP